MENTRWCYRGRLAGETWPGAIRHNADWFRTPAYLPSSASPHQSGNFWRDSRNETDLRKTKRIPSSAVCTALRNPRIWNHYLPTVCVFRETPEPLVCFPVSEIFSFLFSLLPIFVSVWDPAVFSFFFPFRFNRIAGKYTDPIWQCFETCLVHFLSRAFQVSFLLLLSETLSCKLYTGLQNCIRFGCQYRLWFTKANTDCFSLGHWHEVLSLKFIVHTTRHSEFQRATFNTIFGTGDNLFCVRNRTGLKESEQTSVWQRRNERHHTYLICDMPQQWHTAISFPSMITLPHSEITRHGPERITLS